MVAESHFENRIGVLEQRVAEHEIKLEAACASLEKVADRLDKVCENLARLVGEEAARSKFVDMLIGASATMVLGIVAYLITG